jgi:DNA-directed RNA polymerase specialized sigma24 family protein
VTSHAGYQVFYQATSRRTFRRALLLYRSPRDAEDAAQEALLAAYEQWEPKVSPATVMGSGANFVVGVTVGGG